MNTAPTTLKLNQWEKLLFDSGVHKGRYERGAELLEKISQAIAKPEDIVKGDGDEEPQLFREVFELIEQEKNVNQQYGQASDQCLQAADSERNRYELERSRFTAQAIAKIMEVTAVNRG